MRRYNQTNRYYNFKYLDNPSPCTTRIGLDQCEVNRAFMTLDESGYLILNLAFIIPDMR